MIWFFPVGLAFLAGALFGASRQIWSVQLGEWIVVRRLFRSDRHHRSCLNECGFFLREGVFVQEPVSGETGLYLAFDDGRHIIMPMNDRYCLPAMQALGIKLPETKG
jgi:hypothetical protein